MEVKDAIGFIHFDRGNNNKTEALVVSDKIKLLSLNQFVKIKDMLFVDKIFVARVIEGPFYQPEEVSRESALAQISILYGQDFKAPPKFYATYNLEVIGELGDDRVIYSGSRPSPQSAILKLSNDELNLVLNIKEGNLLMGHLAGYPDIPIKFNSRKIEYLPRNLGIFGTVGSGKTNTAQVLIEELINADPGWAVIILDVEGEYTKMNEPNTEDALKLKQFNIEPEGIKNFVVKSLCHQEYTADAPDQVTLRISDIEPYVLSEIIEATEPQAAALARIMDILDEQSKAKKTDYKEDGIKSSQSTTGFSLKDILNKIDNFKTDNPEEQLGVRKGSLMPLKRKLYSLLSTRIFDDPTAQKINVKDMLIPHKLTVFDLSYTGDYEKNILTAQLLEKIFEEKKRDSETKKYPPTIIMIEEAHTFISKDKVDKMFETMRILKEIARRGRKRWLSLCFISQQPSHLPAEIFELANTRIVHNIKSKKNLDILQNSSGDVAEEMWDSVPGLDVGHAVINGPQFKKSLVAKMRVSKSKRRRME